MKDPYPKTSPMKEKPIEVSKDIDKKYLNPDDECNCTITDD